MFSMCSKMFTNATKPKNIKLSEDELLSKVPDQKAINAIKAETGLLPDLVSIIECYARVTDKEIRLISLNRTRSIIVSHRAKPDVQREVFENELREGRFTFMYPIGRMPAFSSLSEVYSSVEYIAGNRFVVIVSKSLSEEKNEKTSSIDQCLVHAYELYFDNKFFILSQPLLTHVSAKSSSLALGKYVEITRNEKAYSNKP